MPTAKLKEITHHFVSELDKGLSVAGGSIVSYLDTHAILMCQLRRLTQVYIAHEPNMGHVIP